MLGTIGINKLSVKYAHGIPDVEKARPTFTKAFVIVITKNLAGPRRMAVLPFVIFD